MATPMSAEDASRRVELAYRARLAIARAMRTTYATRRSVELRAEDGVESFVKSRRVGAELLRHAGNALQVAERSGTRFLADHAWLAREEAVARALGRPSPSLSPNGAVRSPRVPGAPLANILRDAAVGTTEKLAAMSRAVGALRALHAAGFTHADATSENVLVRNGDAALIDFETAHDETLDDDEARADDVRALVFSSVWAAGGLAGPLVRTSARSYDDAAVWSHVERFAARSRWPLYHLAQAPMDWPLFSATCAAIRARG